jgi:hypothetical protein
MEGKQATSCAANSFWMTKPILLNTTSRDLGDITLQCITFYTLFKISTAA